jgi:hypothetical protein
MEAPGDEPTPVPESAASESDPSIPPGRAGAGPGPPEGDAPEAEVASPPPSRSRLWVVVAVVAVAVVVVLGLSFTGLLGSRYDLLAPQSPGVESVPFSVAYAAANASAQAQGGSWGLVEALAFDVPGSGPYPFPQPNGSSPCDVGSPPTFVNSGPGDATRGLSPYWVIGFESTTNLSDLTVAVVNGQAQVLGTTPPNTPCDGAGRAGLLAPAPSIEDSPAAVGSLPNLSAFVRSYPNTTVVFFLTDLGGEIGRVSGTADWLVEASPCPYSIPSNGYPGDPVYIGGTNGTTSHVYRDASTVGYGACETPGTLGATLQLNPTVMVTNPPTGGTTYTVGIKSVVGNTLAPTDFHPAVYPGVFGPTSPKAFQPSQLNFSLVSATGAPVAKYNFTTEDWTVGGEFEVVAGESLELNSTTSLEGASLVLISDAVVTGQLGIFLP